MVFRSDQDDPEQYCISSQWRLDAIDYLDRALYTSRSCLYERNVRYDTVTIDFMGNQIGCVKGATLVSGLELTDGDGFHRG
jgi:hypothetical protein